MQVTSKSKSEIQEQALKNLIESHNKKTAKSKQLVQKNRPVLADRSALGIKFSPNIKEICYPIIIERSQGSRICDVDGNEYVDILMGLGVNLLGHNPPFIKEAIAQQEVNQQMADEESKVKVKMKVSGKEYYEPKLETKKYRRTSRRQKNQNLQDLYDSQSLEELEEFEDDLNF